MGRLTEISLEFPRATVAVLAAITLLLAAGLPRLRTDAGFRAYVGEDHPAVDQLDAFVERFGGGLPVAAVWSCADTDACEHVFDPSALMMAYTVATWMRQADGVLSVESPATSAIIVPSDVGFSVRRPVENGLPARDLEFLRNRALDDPLWIGQLISADGMVGAIIVQLASSDSSVNFKVMRSLEIALQPFETEGYEFHLVGEPVEFVVAGADLQSDSIKLVPAIVAVIAAILLLLFRSPMATLIALFSVGLAVVWAFGFMSWLGWPQTAVSQALAPFILVVGVCNAVHLLSRFAAASSGASEVAGAVRRAAGDVGNPCLVASVTTAVGFLSFATSGAISFVHFGVIAAVGVVSGLTLSFSLLAILVVLTRPHVTAVSEGSVWKGILDGLAAASQRRAPLILLGAVVLGAVGIFSTRWLRVEVDIYHMFGEESQVVKWTRFVESSLRDTDTLEISLALPEGQSLEEPRVLSQIQSLAKGLEALDGLVQAQSVLEPLGWVNRILHDDRPEFDRPADRAAANAELMLLLSLQNPESIDQWVSLDHRELRMSVQTDADSYTQSGRILRDVRSYMDASLGSEWRVELTGPMSALYHMIDEVQATQLRSFGTATAVVFVLVVIFLRSLSWALAAMIPTLLPVIVTLGAMGIWDIYLDMGTAMVAAVVLGIAIDDTVHLLTQYRRRLVAGMAPDRAIREAVRHVGRAVVTTSVALSMGFFVLTLSSWESVASFGFLSGVAILGAMVADLVVLPALLTSFSRFQRVEAGHP